MLNGSFSPSLTEKKLTFGMEVISSILHYVRLIHELTMLEDDLVFISYAREDQQWADRLYTDLRKQEINAWIDVRCLKAGANWKYEIPKVIRKARYFLLLISKHSVTKKGYVQKEIKEGLDVLEELPTGEIFLIPVRLDNTVPIDSELHELNWVDLLPAYHIGLSRILSVLVELKPEPLLYNDNPKVSTSITFIDKGKEVIADMPLLLGERAAISYLPFRTTNQFLQQFFDRLPTDSIFADNTLSFYVTVDTKHEKLVLGDDLLKQYPTQIILVLQNVFQELQIWDEGISIVLSFSGKKRKVAIPFESIMEINVPELGLRIALELSSGYSR